ncbi:MAG: 2-C-methyl-D-erythritol 2,4-cyclodiphosphate synthase [Chloroflexi bacterium]|nr:2-C-methyl-D-erythritol 2,4-cyclodiphosphate synthase [Chloroflexota bacterium]MCH8201335.1 2-C-methyl-D-erythritol 2,4-cyclodiphosphate synthase [Chloroflexota bacterium]MCI0784317.1 2-C-methyl-D-erythritol 2,4-cyclodiphosphate synthase [Chloroflexota bacterium]MCI0814568.1 2-C-methyl-D-erythritol 2,4-cyclodiphosphate synthase [Chloroflexota bacterium]MCI0818604.1 2-C-methyl-D-erythritol 2,4-cyclodiphosphate synthase [Chloroflexota bacterium]
MRIGIGYDIHRFGPGRTLVLGGVVLPGEPGLAGHSDADVVLHAVIDALLGAAALGDIGTHFPADAAEWKDAQSSLLLERTLVLVRDSAYAVENIDVTVIAEKPRLAPHVAALRARMAKLIGVAETAVSVKATTNEGVGEIGRGEAIAAVAVALLREA